MSDDDHRGGYDLLYPFVVCESNGGPYEDRAFVSGVIFGEASAALQRGDAEWQQYVPPPLVPQLDLLAMHHGYTVTSEPWEEHPDDHALVTLTLAPGGAT